MPSYAVFCEMCGKLETVSYTTANNGKRYYCWSCLNPPMSFSEEGEELDDD